VNNVTFDNENVEPKTKCIKLRLTKEYMHNISTTMNNKALLKYPLEPTQRSDESLSLETNKPQNLATMNIDRENRLSRMITLYSKGLTQSEIASELGIDQSTVSRDLQFIKQEAKKKIEKYLNEDILFEFLRYMAGSNEVTRHLWELVQNEENAKDKLNALSLLMQCYNKRLEMLIGGPESYLNAKKSVSEAKFQERVDNDPVLKMLHERNRFSPFSNGITSSKKIY
jgi:transcriptional regulator with XRE-family HTH domain